MPRLSAALALMLSALPLLAAANGAWLKSVSPADHNRTNPYSGQPEAIAAGKALYSDYCSRCHGAGAQGHGSRPALISDRIANATDGDLAWILKNGSTYKGMPNWNSLPEPQRWQIISYIRSLQIPAATSVTPPSEPHQ